MRRIFHHCISQPLLLMLFVILLVTLFLGDGKQSIIDIVSAGGTLSLLIVARFFSVKRRTIPAKIAVSWMLFLLYLVIRTVFSDDVGYSVYITIRWIEMYLIFSVFYSYSTPETIRVLPRWFVGFSLISLVAAVMYTLSPVLEDTLLLANLLTPVYGHNHIIDILLFGYPIALLWYMRKQSWKRLGIVGFLLSGIIFSFARAGIALAAAFSFIVVFSHWKYLTKKSRVIFSVVLAVFLLGGTVMFVIPKQSIKELSGLNPEASNTTEKPLCADARFEYWRQALAAINERPMFGSGPGTFLLLSKRFQNSPLSYSSYAHNSVLEFTAELGVVGFLFGAVFFIWFVRNIKTYFESYKKESDQVMNVILVVISMQCIYALLDFSLAFFIIQALFVVCVSVVAVLFDQKKRKNEQTTSTYVYVGSAIIVLLFYCNEIFCITVDPKHPPLSYCCLLSESGASDVINGTKGKNDSNLNAVIRVLHRKNPEALLFIGRHKEALFNNPLDVKMFKESFSYLVKDNKPNELADILYLLICMYAKDFYTSEEIYANIKMIVPLDTHTDEDISFLGDPTNVKEGLSKILYYYGLRVISQNPQTTRIFWEIATNLSPQWGHFHVELAGLYTEYFHDDDKAAEVLKHCMQYVDPREQCKNALEYGIPTVGSLEKTIKRIPK